MARGGRRRGGAPALVVLLGLAGCAVSDDPRDGGFVSGVVDLVSGSYDARIAREEEAVRSEENAARRLQARAAEVSQARANVALEIGRMQSELDGVRQRIGALQASLAATKADAARKAEAARLAAAERRAAQMANRLDALKREQRSAEDIMAELRRHGADMNDLSRVVDAVAGGDPAPGLQGEGR